jgi:CRP/FNR family transcriptional regulator
MFRVGPDSDFTDFAPPAHKGEIRTLASREILFKAGDLKTHIYRVEQGVICLYDPRWNGDKSLIEFVFPGEFVGLGFLDSQTLTACAFVETVVACLPLGIEAEIAAADPRAETMLAEAVEREFESRRDRLSEAGTSKPLERVAALLVNLSASNRYEGRDPNLITDSWDCGTIGDMLGIGVDDLAEILVDLEQLDLVEPDVSGGLRLIDVEGLEAMADGAVKAPGKRSYDLRVRPPKLPENWSVAA